MNAKLTRGGGLRKTPRSLIVSKVGGKTNNKTKSNDQLESISYDYDAALSQPDLTSFFKKEDEKIPTNNDKTIVQNDEKAEDHRQDPHNSMEKPTDLRIKLEDREIFKQKDCQATEKTVVIQSRESVETLCPKSAPIEKKTSGNKLATVNKCPKSSRIPRAKYTVFSRLPRKNNSRAKKSSARLAPAKSKSAISSAGEARQVIVSTAKLKPPPPPQQEAEIKDRELSARSISVVASALASNCRNVLFEEKCSGIEADVEIDDPDQDFTTSVDDSPRGFIDARDPTIAAVLRASKLSCPCRSCHDHNLAVSKYPIDSDICWMDSRSSPQLGIYSGRNRKPKNRNLAEISRSQGYLDFTSNESSDTELTTESSIYETTRKNKKKKKKQQRKRQIPSEISCPRVVPFAKPRDVQTPAPKMKAKPRLRFSFFNTLFDIVFWPFLFLRSDR